MRHQCSGFLGSIPTKCIQERGEEGGQKRLGVLGERTFLASDRSRINECSYVGGSVDVNEIE
jgi:hypothetical protein